MDDLAFVGEENMMKEEFPKKKGDMCPIQPKNARNRPTSVSSEPTRWFDRFCRSQPMT